MRTDDEIKREIDKLREIKPSVVKKSFFGDDNHAALDAVVNVLENELTSEDVWDEYEDSEHLRSSADGAVLWLSGDNDDRPSEGWPIKGE